MTGMRCGRSSRRGKEHCHNAKPWFEAHRAEYELPFDEGDAQE